MAPLFNTMKGNEENQVPVLWVEECMQSEHARVPRQLDHSGHSVSNSKQSMFFAIVTMFATRNKCIASSNKCLTSSNKKLVEL